MKGVLLGILQCLFLWDCSQPAPPAESTLITFEEGLETCNNFVVNIEGKVAGTFMGTGGDCIHLAYGTNIFRSLDSAPGLRCNGLKRESHCEGCDPVSYPTGYENFTGYKGYWAKEEGGCQCVLGTCKTQYSCIFWKAIEDETCNATLKNDLKRVFGGCGIPDSTAKAERICAAARQAPPFLDPEFLSCIGSNYPNDEISANDPLLIQLVNEVCPTPR